MGHIALLNLLVRAEKCGYATQIIGKLLMISTGESDVAKIEGDKRVLGISHCSVLSNGFSNFWLIVEA